jgi:hypothetical protein
MRITCGMVNTLFSETGHLCLMGLFPLSSKLHNVCSPSLIQLVVDFAGAEKQDPVILLSHIPLARSESAHCGPLREQGTIRRGAGPGWQSTLSKESSKFLLNTLRPSIIFSYVLYLCTFSWFFEYRTGPTTVITATTHTPIRTQNDGIHLHEGTAPAKSRSNPSPCLYTSTVQDFSYSRSSTRRISLQRNTHQPHMIPLPWRNERASFQISLGYTIISMHPFSFCHYLFWHAFIS